MAAAILLVMIGLGTVVTAARPHILTDARPRQETPAFFTKTYPESRHVYPVLRVLDGDTIDVQTSEVVAPKSRSGNPCKATPGRKRIRFLGVNAPEIKGPFGKQEQPWGPEAAARMHELLDGRAVWMEIEPGARRDLYGRTLAHLYRYPDGMYVNAQVLAEGLARPLTEGGFPKRNQATLALALTAGQDAKRGIWQGEGSSR